MGFKTMYIWHFDNSDLFLPTPPPRGAWVFRWQVSPPLPLPHLQFFVSLRYRTFLLGTENAVGGGGMGLWQCMPSCFYSLTIGHVWDCRWLKDPPSPLQELEQGGCLRLKFWYQILPNTKIWPAARMSRCSLSSVTSDSWSPWSKTTRTSHTPAGTRRSCPAAHATRSSLSWSRFQYNTRISCHYAAVILPPLWARGLNMHLEG